MTEVIIGIITGCGVLIYIKIMEHLTKKRIRAKRKWYFNKERFKLGEDEEYSVCERILPNLYNHNKENKK